MRRSCKDNANMWRISDDFWDDWKALRLNFILMSIWSRVGRPGAWPDADMLPLGRIGIRAERGEAGMTRFTRDGQRTREIRGSVQRGRNGPGRYTFHVKPHGSGIYKIKSAVKD
jgi:hypothetical protein